MDSALWIWLFSLLLALSIVMLAQEAHRYVDDGTFNPLRIGLWTALLIVASAFLTKLLS